jgi:FkbM family methyltransferase
MKTLVYVGLYMGNSFDKSITKFDRCFGFEANPELATRLKRKYARNDKVTIVHGAVTTFNGTIQLNISSNQGGSSSVGTFNKEWPNFAKGEISMSSKVEVPAYNLLDYLETQGVESVQEYVSDIQGMDLEVLKTLQPLLEARKIERIACEVARNEFGNIYGDLPDNSEAGFGELLDENYEMVANGWGVLQEGKFPGVPDDWWEMDCMWKLKSWPTKK